MSSASLEELVSLAKRRGFIFQGSEIYGGLAGTWDYGPLGVALKKNLTDLWWSTFVEKREDMYGVDAAILMNKKVWEASGHVDTFTDPMVECSSCGGRFREDQVAGDKCPTCGKEGTFGEPRQFNMMFRTEIGPTWSSFETDDDKFMSVDIEVTNRQGEALVKHSLKKDAKDQNSVIVYDKNSMSYLRPETAQGIFTNFKNVVDTQQPDLPFGIAQIGKAFRNEISPRDFVFRSREFSQMEIEYFIPEDGWEEQFDNWREAIMKFLGEAGVDTERVHELEVGPDDLAHYSKRTIDYEFEYPHGKDELLGLAYRGNFDLSNIEKGAGKKMLYAPKDGGKAFVPHVIEPSFGVERLVMAVLVSAYTEDEQNGEKRVFLKLPENIAPVKICVGPLKRNAPELVEKAREIYEILQAKHGRVVWDDNSNIGKRYRRQDEIGTPRCITVDFDTLEDGTVTVRDRDTLEQSRLKPENI